MGSYEVCDMVGTISQRSIEDERGLQRQSKATSRLGSKLMLGSLLGPVGRSRKSLGSYRFSIFGYESDCFDPGENPLFPETAKVGEIRIPINWPGQSGKGES